LESPEASLELRDCDKALGRGPARFLNPLCGLSVARAHDTILRCRINAAFRSQVERRIYAAEGSPEEICPAPPWR